MKALVLRSRIADPRAVIAFGQRIFFAAEVKLHALRGRRDDAGAHAPLGIHLRKLFARLVD